jgi:hypothetical protein
LLWHGIAIIALVLMTVCAESAVLATAALLASCALAARAIDDRALARMFSHRPPAIAAGMSAACTGTAAALAVPLVAASLGSGARAALLWLAGVELLAVTAAAVLVSIGRAGGVAAARAGAPGERPFALLSPGSRTEPPTSC